MTEYRKDCDEMFARFGGTNDPNQLYWVARVSVLSPDATADWPRVVAVAEKAVQSDPKSQSYMGVLGAALFRAGRLEEGIERLTQVDALASVPDPTAMTSPDEAWLFLAMTQHRLGRVEDSKKSLAKAVASSEEATRKPKPGNEDVPWNRRALKVLREEAEALTRAAAEPNVPSEKGGKTK